MSKLVICEEMQKLRNWLTKQDIVWYDDSYNGECWMCTTVFKIGKNRYSVINGVGSYGGLVDVMATHNNGLLEYRENNKEPIGWLTAEDVIGSLKVS